MPDNEDKLLCDAVARNSGAVLSLPSAGMLRHCKSRFLGEQQDGLLVEAPSDQTALVNTLIAAKQDIVIAFKSGIHKVAFATFIINPIPQWQVSETSMVDALLLAKPQKVETLQRRAYYRARVPRESIYRARVWRIAEYAIMRDVPLRSQEVRCELRDLSVGGIGVRFATKDGTPPKISTTDRLRIEIIASDQSIVLEGRMREPRKHADGAAILAGVAFKKLEDNLDGRRALAQLTRIVGELQREELRQNRMGLAPTA